MSKRTCSVIDCTNPSYARGWCSMHYTRWRRKQHQQLCVDCNGPRHRQADNGRCSSCYWKWRRAGSPFTELTRQEYDAQRYDSAKRRDKFLRDKHGITLEDYNRLWADQQGRCAICGHHENTAMTTHSKLVVDHDHKTGSVRGLLCDLCNKGLGQFKDDLRRVQLAANYLEVHDGRMDSGMGPVVGDVRSHRSASHFEQAPR